MFDSAVVHEYVDWTGNMGGPLVTTDNVTTRSDLRLYESDGNATMQSLYEMGDAFQSTCVDLMGRMVNTVPGDVELQGAISPIEVKPINVTFDFNNEGQLIVSGRLRVGPSSPTHPLFSPHRTYHRRVPGTITKRDIIKKLSSAAEDSSGDIGATILSEDNSETPLSLQAEPETGSSIYGTTTYYAFSDPLNQDVSYESIIVRSTGLPEETFTLQNEVFIVPSMTILAGNVINITIAARSSLQGAPLAAKVAAPVGQQGTLGPTILRQTTTASKAITSPISGYDLWYSSLDLGGSVTGAVSISVGAGEGLPDDVFYVHGGAAGW